MNLNPLEKERKEFHQRFAHFDLEERTRRIRNNQRFIKSLINSYKESYIELSHDEVKQLNDLFNLTNKIQKEIKQNAIRKIGHIIIQ